MTNNECGVILKHTSYETTQFENKHCDEEIWLGRQILGPFSPRRLEKGCSLEESTSILVDSMKFVADTRDRGDDDDGIEVNGKHSKKEIKRDQG